MRQSPVMSAFLPVADPPFDPRMVADCALWLDSSQGVQTDAAGNFVAASSQSLSVADNTSLRVQGQDFWCSVWVNMATVGAGAYRSIVGKDNGTLREWDLIKNNLNRFQFQLGGVGLSVLSAATPTAATWVHFFVYRDIATNTVGIITNSGTPVTASNSTAVTGTAAPFTIGVLEQALISSFWDGGIGPVFFGKSPPGGFATTSAATMAAAFWNGGNGRDSLTPTEITQFGAVSAWLTNAQTSLTADSIGSNILTNNNGVTVGAGAILTPAYFGSNMSRWTDRAAGTVTTQPTYANRTTLANRAIVSTAASLGVGLPAPIGTPNGVSVCATIVRGSAAGERVVFGHEWGSSGFYLGNTGVNFVFRINNGGGTAAVPIANIVVGTTYRVVGTYDLNTIRLYVNGSQVASASYSSAVGSIAGQTPRVGAYASAVGAPWVGNIGETVVYARGLTPAEVQRDYQYAVRGF